MPRYAAIWRRAAVNCSRPPGRWRARLMRGDEPGREPESESAGRRPDADAARLGHRAEQRRLKLTCNAKRSYRELCWRETKRKNYSTTDARGYKQMHRAASKFSSNF